jgi:signal peptidase II
LKKLLFVLFCTLLIDQASKAAVILLMQPGESVPVISDFARLTFVRNTGTVFGLLSGNNLPLIFTTLIATAALVFLVWRSRKSDGRLTFPLVLVLAGALGNLADRLRLGQVVDFLDLGVGHVRWPVFNVADIAVTVGVVLFCYRSIFSERRSGVRT